MSGSIHYNAALNEGIQQWLKRFFAQTERVSRSLLHTRNCPVCNSSSHIFAFNNGFLDYVRCNDCSLLFMNPSPDPTRIDRGFVESDELITEYIQIILKHRNGKPVKPDPMQHNKLRDIYELKQNGRLLDVGCSLGDFLRIASYFYEVAGVEVNPLTADIAAREFLIYCGFLQDINLKPEYDIVTLHQVLYGVPDPVTLFSEVHKILKNDGILYVNTPNADSYAMKCYQGKANHLYGHTTLNVFNRRSLEMLAQRTGFKIRSFRTEWLDIYFTDLLIYLGSPDEFIHKKNVQVPGYEDLLQREDEFQENLNLDLGNHGNYLVAVLAST